MATHFEDELEEYFDAQCKIFDIAFRQSLWMTGASVICILASGFFALRGSWDFALGMWFLSMISMGLQEKMYCSKMDRSLGRMQGMTKVLEIVQKDAEKAKGNK